MAKSDRDACRCPNGNCSMELDPVDGFPVQCVGPWACDKHDYVRRYIDAAWAARSKWLAPLGNGGAAFIDLYAGPGRARIAPGRFIDGSPLIALKQQRAPFSKVILCDKDPENVAALKHRAGADSRAHVMHVDSNSDIDQIVAEIPPNGYNLALVDPFAASALHFPTIERLASVRRLDLIINFPLPTMKRNYQNPKHAERFLGVPHEYWEVPVNENNDPLRGRELGPLLDLFRRQLRQLGYTACAEIRAPAVRNTHDLALYYLVFSSKHELGDHLWNSVTAREPDGQMNLL